jgi:putative endopeptidase
MTCFSFPTTRQLERGVLALSVLVVLASPVLRAQTAPPAAGPAAVSAPMASPSAAAANTLHAFDPALRDTSADPCTDFYQYACGGWLKQHPIPEDRSSYGRDTEVEDLDQQVLRSILENAARENPAPNAPGHPDNTGDLTGNGPRSLSEQKIGDAYAACMDTDQINTAALKPLQPTLDAITALQSKNELPALLAQLHKQGVPGFFQFRAQQDYRDATQQIAAVEQPRLGLPEKGYYERLDAKSAALRQEYVDHISRTFVLLGETPVQAGLDANIVLRIETALAAASLSQVEMRDPSRLYHKTPLEQFLANSPSLAFAGYLKSVGAPSVQSLNVAEPVYFLQLEELLGATSVADIQTFLRWNVARSIPGTAVEQPLDDEDFSFYGKVLAGVPQQQPRWKRCADTVDRELGEALGQVYVAQRFSAADKAQAVELTKAIEQAADRDIDHLDWMSQATRVQAKEKLHRVANNIGYPNTWRDYSTLSISRTDAFGNAERADAFQVERNIRKIGRPVDRGEWEMTPPTVNAYYNPQMNSINFPAGILQPPYFDPAQDDAVNFGSAGAVIGHELTHGFDDEGRQFDGQGNLRDWWKKADAKQFGLRAQCVENEYSSFLAVDTLHVNGKLTLGENLADLAGLRLAWLAYQSKAKASNVTLDKPGDAAYGGLTPQQQFFAAYGQSWCENTRPAAMRERVQVDPHSPEKYRVNGVLENVPSFAEAFSCKAGSPMVAATRCTLW